MVYIFFLRLYKYPIPGQPKPTNPILLLTDQFSLQIDTIVLPSILEVSTIQDTSGNLVPNSNIIQYIPQSRLVAAYLNSALSKLIARTSSINQSNLGNKDQRSGISTRLQQVGIYLNPYFLDKLTWIIAVKVRENPKYIDIFSDFVIYFSCKNIKLQFIGSGKVDIPTTIDQNFYNITRQFLDFQDNCFVSDLLDLDHVFIDLGKQTTAIFTTLPGDDYKGVVETYLYRNCYLQATIDNRLEQLSDYYLLYYDHAIEPNQVDSRRYLLGDYKIDYQSPNDEREDVPFSQSDYNWQECLVVYRVPLFNRHQRSRSHH